MTDVDTLWRRSGNRVRLPGELPQAQPTTAADSGERTGAAGKGVGDGS